MGKYRSYSPDQAYLLPPHVREVLGEDHLCFFVHRVVERLDLEAFDKEYVEEGRPAYAPVLLLKVWLYAYALGVTSSRRLEQRIREDLGFRYLAGGAVPDHWTLNAFRKRHGRGLNDVFTQVLEVARELGLCKLGQVAIDSTRIAANAARERMDEATRLRRERSRIRRQIRRWQRQCNAEEGNEGCGMELPSQKVQQLEQRLATLPQRLERLRKSGLRLVSRTDPESRYLRERRGHTLGYTAELAVNDEHLIVAQRVTQNASDNDSLVPLVQQVEQECRKRPEKVSADAGFFSLPAIEQLQRGGVEVYVPDPHMAHELKGGKRARGMGQQARASARINRLRRQLRTPEGRRIYAQRKMLVEPVFGVLKEQRGLRRFRRRGLAAVAVEFSLAAIAFNLTRLYTLAG